MSAVAGPPEPELGATSPGDSARPELLRLGSPVFDPPPTDVATGRKVSRSLAVEVLARTWHRVLEDRVLGLSAEVGFWAIVSLPSLLLTVLGAIGYLRGPLGNAAINRIHDQVLQAARDVLTPGTVNSDVAPLVNQVLGQGHLAVISVGFVISLWSGSTAMSDYVNTITVAYGMRGLRSAWRSRLVAVGLYLCFVVVGLVLLPALALGPTFLSSLAPDQIGDQVSVVVRVLYWPVVALLSVLLLSALYRLALPVAVRWRRGLPGAVLAMGLWLVLSFAARAYLTSSLRARSAYGSLGATIAALLFFYVTALAVLIGAEFNSAIDHFSPSPTTTAGRERSQRPDEAARS